MPYATPPADLIPVVDAPPPPSVSMAPGGRYLVLLHYAAHPEIAMLARPYLALAGLRIDQQLRARRRLRRAGRLSVLRIADGHEYSPGLPEGAQVGFPVWAADGRRFAFTVDRPRRSRAVGRGRGDRRGHRTARAGHLRRARRRTRLGRRYRALVPRRAVAAGAGLPAGQPGAAGTGRRATARGDRGEAVTARDLSGPAAHRDRRGPLRDRWPPRSRAGWTRPAGSAPSLARPGSTTPCSTRRTGRSLLVQRLHRPFSFRVPWVWFARCTEVWDGDGRPRAVIADQPVSDEVPRQGVPLGPRLVGWEERAPASLTWVEALDGGDPVAPAEFRDRVFRLTGPFDTGGAAGARRAAPLPRLVRPRRAGPGAHGRARPRPPLADHLVV